VSPAAGIPGARPSQGSFTNTGLYQGLHPSGLTVATCCGTMLGSSEPTSRARDLYGNLRARR
jgi:hypothetical protein